MKKAIRSLWSVIEKMRQRPRREVNVESPTVTKYFDAWRAEAIPAQQWKLVEEQLSQLAKGVWSPEFAAFCRAIERVEEELGRSVSNLVEVGCSSGYYSKVLHIHDPEIQYTGIDFSPSFVEFGKKKFEGIDLRVGDTTNLPLEDDSYEVVVSGSVLLHVVEWRLGIEETCRVAKHAVVLHRTPVSTGPTTLFTKTAYGERMIEWTFNEEELLAYAEHSGFRVLGSWPVYPGDVIGLDPASPTQFTYVLMAER